MISLQRSLVIGTAGHIDHGKTTLVRALTGIDADRLPEEKRRGITIDLGFASFQMEIPDQPPIRISFVDVPGHSHFIRNMLAGASCVSAVLLVIAANEGVMPQTVEHLAICKLLGISHGITVITKIDSVDASHLAAVRQSVEAFLQNTFLAADRSPLLEVSASTGEGIQDLRAQICNLAMRRQRESTDSLLRMPIDRSFVMKGFGTVATGTLISGTIREGQSLQLQPGFHAVRVRGLQNHGEPQKAVEAGSRVAVNLSGVDAADLRRGQTAVQPDTLQAVNVIDVEITLLEDAPLLKHRANVHFHALTSETMTAVSLYGYGAIQPGRARIGRLKLSVPMVLVPGDRFVIRQPLPAGTVGGGRVLDVHPQKGLRKSEALTFLERLTSSSEAQQIELRVSRRNKDGITIHSLSIETGLTIEAVRQCLRDAMQRGDILAVTEDLLLDRRASIEVTEAIIDRLKSSLQAVKKSELRSQTGLRSEIFEFAIKALLKQNKIDVSNEALSIHTIELKIAHRRDEQMDAISQAYEAAGLATPSVMDIAQRFGLGEVEIRKIITALQRSKTIVRLGSDELFVHSATLERLAQQITALRGSTLDVSRFKQITGVSRKYAIPLLEYLDRQRVTRKQGDSRLVL